MNWYKTLDVHKRINLKAYSYLICGISFTDLGSLFSFEERMNLIYNKLKIEGFDIP